MVTWTTVVAVEGGYILKLKPTGCDDRLDVWSERREGSEAASIISSWASRTLLSSTVATSHIWLFN